jgi:hypothetical protein
MLRIVAAALVATAVLFDASIAPSFTGPTETTGVQRTGKADRLDIRTAVGSACSQAAWPYYESGCLRDKRQGPQPRSVRIIPIERPSAKPLTVASAR